MDTDPIYNLDLVQTVTVVYSEAMDNGVDPTINAASSSHWSQGAGVWSTTTFTDDTYTVDMTHDGTAEEIIGESFSSSGAQDVAGNVEGASTPDTFDIDTLISVDSVVIDDTDGFINMQEADSGLDIIVTTTGVEDGQEVSCIIADTEVNSVGPVTGNILTGTVTIASGNLSTLADAVITATCTVFDLAGNDAGNADTSTLDETIPAFTNSDNQTVYDNESLAYDMAITDDNGIVFSDVVSDNADTDFTITNAGLLENSTAMMAGTYRLMVTAVDTPGNENQVSLILTILTPTSALATNETTTVENGTDTIVFNDLSVNVEEIIIPSDIPEDTEITLDMSALLNGSNQVEIPNNITLSREGELQNYSAFLEEGTVIIGNGSWDGTITLPTVKLASDYDVSSGDVDAVIDLGTAGELNFSAPVKILIGGMAGKEAAWARGSTSLTKITTECNSTTPPTNINETSPRECYRDSGDDLEIWTYHFTAFAAYTTVTSSSGGSTWITSWASTTSISGAELAEGITKSLGVRQKLQFSISGENHYVALVSFSVNTGTAIFEIASTPFQTTLNEGETKSYDITGDGTDDIALTLESVETTTATLTLKLAEGVEVSTSGDIETLDSAEEAVPEIVEQETEKSGPYVNSIIFIALGIIVLAIIIYFVFGKKKSGEKHGRKSDPDTKYEELEEDAEHQLVRKKKSSKR